MTKNEIGAIILAAGMSSRLGKPKQLLPFKGSNLLQNTIDIVVSSDIDAIVLVTGSEMQKIIGEINIKGIDLAHNEDWHTGMTSSIICGLHHLLSIKPLIQAVIILVCDQPYLEKSIIKDIVYTYNNSDYKIIQCRYLDGVGPPVLFDKIMFDHIFSVKDSFGARSVIKAHGDKTGYVSFPKGNIDIDTQHDYDQLISQ